jgi:hypothetical protein
VSCFDGLVKFGASKHARFPCDAAELFGVAVLARGFCMPRSVPIVGDFSLYVDGSRRFEEFVRGSQDVGVVSL